MWGVRDRELRFVGSSTDDAVRPITSDLGMSRQLKKVSYRRQGYFIFYYRWCILPVCVYLYNIQVTKSKYSTSSTYELMVHVSALYLVRAYQVLNTLVDGHTVVSDRSDPYHSVPTCECTLYILP